MKTLDRLKRTYHKCIFILGTGDSLPLLPEEACYLIDEYDTEQFIYKLYES